ncbi:UNVERIFIED_CONTAM: hypothetical protein FKN15_062039 [Acipenser sinensis]
MHLSLTLLLGAVFTAVAAVAGATTDQPANHRPDSSPPLLRRWGQLSPKRAPKQAETQDGAPQRGQPLPQRMPPPKNNTLGALVPPPRTAPAQGPVPRWGGDLCRGYYDVMGQYDHTFNCSTNTFLYCCGTCHYRFCCEHRGNRLDQGACNNYDSPEWAHTPPPTPAPPGGHRPDPDFNALKGQNNSTLYIVGGVILATLAVAVGAKLAFHKASRNPRDRDINVPRALVDILRNQSASVQHGERNNSTVLGSNTDTGSSRPPKNLYTPVLPSKDNRKKDLDDSSGYYTSKRRSGNSNASPSFHSSQHHLYYGGGGGGEYTLGGHGTLPLHAMRPRLSMTPNPYPAPQPGYEPLDSKPPRRVMSQDQLLVFGEGTQMNPLNNPLSTLSNRMAFAAKRQNTIEQLHFIPGGGNQGGGNGGGQQLRTGKKQERESEGGETEKEERGSEGGETEKEERGSEGGETEKEERGSKGGETEKEERGSEGGEGGERERGRRNREGGERE